MFNELSLVTITGFSGGSLDKNGKSPIMVQAVAGKIPNRNVWAGTIAENKGIEVGQVYLAQFRETQPDPQFGRRFDILIVKGNLSMKDIIDARRELGDPIVEQIEVPESAASILSGTGEATQAPVGVEETVAQE